MAAALGVPFLGSLPLDAALGRAGEEGCSVLERPDAPAPACADALRDIVARVVQAVTEGGQ